MTQGYIRINPQPAPDAVIWWYVREFDDGFVYARGGRVSTTRQARHTIADQRGAADREHQAVLDRPEAILQNDGSLTYIDYGAYDSWFLKK